MNDFNKRKCLKINIDLAEQIGLKESTIVEYIRLCCEINKKNYRDSYYWMYNTLDGFLKYFKFLSKKYFNKMS